MALQHGRVAGPARDPALVNAPRGFETAQGGLLPCRVLVQRHGHTIRQTANDVDLRLGQGGAMEATTLWNPAWWAAMASM